VDASQAFAHLAAAAQAARGDGHLTAAWQELDPAPPSPERLAVLLPHLLDDAGLTPVPPSVLRELPRAAARAVLATALARDLTERRATLEASEANELASRFMDLFGPATRYFTNGEHEDDGTLRTWVPLGTTGLDTGVLALDEAQVGLLWIEDEPEPEEPEPEL
jgi:hypothetical protein